MLRVLSLFLGDWLFDLFILSETLSDFICSPFLTISYPCWPFDCWHWLSVVAMWTVFCSHRKWTTMSSEGSSTTSQHSQAAIKHFHTEPWTDWLFYFELGKADGFFNYPSVNHRISITKKDSCLWDWWASSEPTLPIIVFSRPAAQQISVSCNLKFPQSYFMSI